MLFPLQAPAKHKSKRSDAFKERSPTVSFVSLAKVPMNGKLFCKIVFD